LSSPAVTQPSRRVAEKQANAASDNEPEEEPAPTSDIEPDEDAPKKKPKKGKGRGSGGIKIPEEWPWEEAKKLFEKPDVISEIGFHFSSLTGKTPILMDWCNSS